MIILSYRVHDTLNDNEHKYIYIYTGFPNQTAQFSKLSNTGSHTYRKKRVRANPCQLPIKGHILDNTFCNCKYVSLCSNVAYIYIHIYIHNCPGLKNVQGRDNYFCIGHYMKLQLFLEIARQNVHLKRKATST